MSNPTDSVPSGEAQASLPVPAGAATQSIPTPEPAANVDAASAEQPRPAQADQGSASPDARSRFAEESHQYVSDHIKLADQKAAFFFTAATALLAFLYQNRVSQVWLKKPLMQWNVLDISAFLSMAALAVGALFALFVLMPRLPGSRRGYVFWEAIAEYQSARQYSDDLSTLSQSTFAQQKAEHTHELAIVCRAKYRHLRSAFFVLAIGLFFSIIVLLSFLPQGGVELKAGPTPAAHATNQGGNATAEAPASTSADHQ
jgi:hypothetical protein